MILRGISITISRAGPVGSSWPGPPPPTPPTGRGDNHPQPSFWPFLTPGVVLCHLGVVLSPPLGVCVYPLIGVGLSLQRGGFIPPRGWFYPPLGHFGGGGGYCPFGVVLSPLLGDLSPHWAAGGGGGLITLLGAEGYGASLR